MSKQRLGLLRGPLAMVALLGALTLSLGACGDDDDDGGGGARIDSGVHTGPIIDGGQDGGGDGGSGGLGDECTAETAGGAPPCTNGLVCCVPCGNGGCAPVCSEPCGQEDPGCDLGTGCFLLP